MDGHDAMDRARFRFVVDFLRLRWKTIALVTVLVVAAVMAWSLTRDPVYRSSADVLIEATSQDVLSNRTFEIDAEYVATQVNVVSSAPIAKSVQDKLGLDDTPDLDRLLRVEPIGQSRVIRITAESGTADGAADLAQTVAETYLEERKAQAEQVYGRLLDTLTAQQDSLTARIAEIDKRLDANPTNAASLDAERSSLLGQLSQVTTRLSDLAAADTGGSGGSILQPAEPPGRPSSPDHVVNGLLAAVIGLLLGLGAALLRDRLDDVVHDSETLRTVIGGRPLLGRIPHWDDSRFNSRLVSVLEPRSAAAEAYTALAVEVRFLLTGRQERKTAPTVLILSTVSSESKTTVAGNLAVSMAHVGMDVVALDADLRRGNLLERFGLPSGIPGLADRLLVDDNLAPADPGIRGLRLLGRGRPPANPTELLASTRFREFLVDLEGTCDAVVIDAPPAVVADGMGLLDVADVVLVVTRAGVTRRRDLSALLRRLSNMRAATVAVAISDDRPGPLANHAYYEPGVETS